ARVPEDIEFTKNRYTRRYNLATEDRVKLLNWNAFCIAVTALPIAYVYYSWYESSEDTDMIYRTMDPMREAKADYYLPLLRGH
uniref:Rab-GAP TBC domain-containing protein n=1 Tax=Perkinsus marinus TaxID=31276 RepID=UPI003F77857F